MADHLGQSLMQLHRQYKEVAQQRDELLKALKNMNWAFVNALENGRDRILMLGGECDSIEKMLDSDPNLRNSRSLIEKLAQS